METRIGKTLRWKCGEKSKQALKNDKFYDLYSPLQGVFASEAIPPLFRNSPEEAGLFAAARGTRKRQNRFAGRIHARFFVASLQNLA